MNTAYVIETLIGWSTLAGVGVWTAYGAGVEKGRREADKRNPVVQMQRMGEAFADITKKLQAGVGPIAQVLAKAMPPTWDGRAKD